MLPRTLLRSRRTLPPSVISSLARTYAAAPPPPPRTPTPPATPSPSAPAAVPSAETPLAPPSVPDTSFLMDPKHPKAAPPLVRWLVKRFKIDVSAVARARGASPAAAEVVAEAVESGKELPSTLPPRSGKTLVKAKGEEEEQNAWTKMVVGVTPPKGSTDYTQKEFSKVLSPGASYTLQALVVSLIWLAGVLYPPDIGRLLSPRSAPPAPSADSKEGKEMVKKVETDLQNLPVTKEYRKLTGWYECRPYSTLPEYARNHSLTAGTLRGPSRLAVPPLVFAKDDESEAIVIIHLGRSLCGHDGIVHGGMVATLLDEATGRNALLNLPTKIGVTARLEINYRAPTKADQFVVIKTRLDERKGRKAVVGAEMWTLEGEQLADAKAVYVEPRWAALLKGSGVEELLGKRPESKGVVGGGELGVKPSVLAVDHGKA